MHDKVTGWTQTSSIEAYAQSLRADCDLDLFILGTWVLFATHCLIMIIVCATFFSNPTMHNKVKGQTQQVCLKFTHKF